MFVVLRFILTKRPCYDLRLVSTLAVEASLVGETALMAFFTSGFYSDLCFLTWSILQGSVLTGAFATGIDLGEGLGLPTGDPTIDPIGVFKYELFMDYINCFVYFIF